MNLPNTISRRAWSLALLPLAGAAPSARTTVSATTWAAVMGVLLMSAKTKVVAVVVLAAAVGLSVWSLTSDRPDPRPGPERPVAGIGSPSTARTGPPEEHPVEAPAAPGEEEEEPVV